MFSYSKIEVISNALFYQRRDCVCYYSRCCIIVAPSRRHDRFIQICPALRMVASGCIKFREANRAVKIDAAGCEADRQVGLVAAQESRFLIPSLNASRDLKFACTCIRVYRDIRAFHPQSFRPRTERAEKGPPAWERGLDQLNVDLSQSANSHSLSLFLSMLNLSIDLVSSNLNVACHASMNIAIQFARRAPVLSGPFYFRRFLGVLALRLDCKLRSYQPLCARSCARRSWSWKAQGVGRSFPFSCFGKTCS